MRNVIAWYSLFLNRPFFQENKICNFKIHLFPFLNTKQTNDSIFSNMTGEIFYLGKIFWRMVFKKLKFSLDLLIFLDHKLF